MKRPLTDVEKNMAEKGIKRLELNKKYHEFKIKHALLMINEGLWENYSFKKRQFIMIKSDEVQKVNNINLKMGALMRQLKEGVEIKQKIEQSPRPEESQDQVSSEKQKRIQDFQDEETDKFFKKNMGE